MVMRILYECHAPVEFWCYCLIFAVDCHNYTSKESLGGKVPFTILNDDTPDISAFRFSFWQEIDYFDPNARFPESKWKSGRFLHIDFTSGDAFTFLIWTVDDNGNWTDGRELVRNIIRPRKFENVVENEAQIEEAYKSFKFQKKVPTKKRKGRTKEIVYKLVNLEEIENVSDVSMSSTDSQQNDLVIGSPVEGGSGHTTDTTTPEPILKNKLKRKYADISVAESNESNSEETPESEVDLNATEEVTSEEEGVDFEMVDEVNDQYSQAINDNKTIGGSKTVNIVGHD